MARKEKKEPTESTHFGLTDVRELFQLVNRYGIAEFEFEEGETKIHLVSGRNQPAQQPGAEDGSDKSSHLQQYFPMISPLIGPHQQQMVAHQGFPASAPLPASPADPAPAAEQVSAVDAEKARKEKEREHYIAIKSPMVGTFYRSPSPDSPSYVEVGDNVSEETVVCIVEAMKLFNEIKADVRGRVVEILVENEQPVEYDQEIILIDPAK